MADNDEQTILDLCSKVFGKVCGDKGFIMNPEKMQKLLSKGIHFVTKIRSIMKNICHIEHTRHRSPINFFNNFLSAIAAYAFKPNKPILKQSKKQYRNFNPFQLQLDL